MRMIAGMNNSAVLGWDMAAALSMARAMEMDLAASAELLVVIEAVMARKINEGLQNG